MKTIIHVNQFVIKKNQKTGERKPPISIIQNKITTKSHHVTIEGEIHFIYRPDKPLSCGARLWAETEDEVTYL